jgi:pimeloyl-ACP methyl ester carboxylesterase
MGFPEFGHQHSSFEEQFLNIETIKFGEDKLPALDVSPEKQTSRPVLFVPGWNAKLSDYKSAFKSFVESGRRVISFEPSGTEDEKAGEILSILNLKGLDEIDIIAHSLGAMSSVLAAVQIPERIKHMVLLNPPSDETNPKELIKKYSAMLSFEEAKNLADVGARKIYDMARVITSFDMDKMRQRLNGFGTKVTSIHGLQDILFPPPSTAITIDEVNLSKGQDEFFIEGNHLGIDSFIKPALKLLEM